MSRPEKASTSTSTQAPAQAQALKISVVTPTLRRPREVADLLENLCQQTLLPMEVILVDGAPAQERATEEVVARRIAQLPFPCHYFRHPNGTSIQRNAGIERAQGDLITLLDDDVRLAPDFLEVVARLFAVDAPEGDERPLGGVVGYRGNRYFHPESVGRWRWFRRLRLLRNFEPGRYDFECGYPINVFMQPPFSGTKEVDFMTTACAVWRRQVFDAGLEFDPFFRDYGVLEDAHFSLRAAQSWKLLLCGDAHCQELSAPGGRENRRQVGYKCVTNYYYVFRDTQGPLSFGQRFRFWRFQCFELLRLMASSVRRRRLGDLKDVWGRLQGFWAVASGAAYRGNVKP